MPPIDLVRAYRLVSEVQVWWVGRGVRQRSAKARTGVRSPHPPPKIIPAQYIVQSGLAERIILFGSRARGDHRQNSDFDIAVIWTNQDSQAVLKFKSELVEKSLTLYKVDLLDLNSTSPQYVADIVKEGRVLWQKEG